MDGISDAIEALIVDDPDNSKEREKPSLITIPKKLTQKILDACDYPSIISLHKVNKSLQDFIDKIIPKCDIYQLQLLFDNTDLCLTIYLNENQEPYPKGGRLCITYSPDCSDILVSRNGKTVTRLDASVNQQFVKDFPSIPKHQKAPMDSFKVMGSSSRIQALDEKMYNARCYRSIQAKEFIFDMPSFYDFFTVIGWCDPQVLKKITLIGSHRNVPIEERLFGKTQWRQCAELSAIRHDIPIRHLIHFEKVHSFLSFVLEDILFLKREFIRLGPPKHFIFDCRHLNIDMIEFTRRLGRHYQHEGTENWYWRSPGTNLILHIMMQDDGNNL